MSKNIPKYISEYQNISDNIRKCQKHQNIGIHQNMSDISKFQNFKNISEHNVTEYIKICQILSDKSRISQNMSEYIKMYKSI